MFAREVVAQQRLLCICLPLGCCKATGLHATIRLVGFNAVVHTVPVYAGCTVDF